MRNFKRFVGTAFAVAGLATTVVFTGGGSASAADPNFTFSVDRVGKSFSIEVYNNHVRAGFADWNADPDNSVSPPIPGDALEARDILGDGWGIEAWAATQSGGEGYRMATTRGHAAVYLSGYKTGNIAEGTPITVTVCAVKGAKAQCGSAYGLA
ncbi:hypothetical protein P1P68_20210 [Streptomyces scabiei]|uniref:hypothetical protein n=1 Tax=Streptomyces scabiei TaxID=1930 RepID=UPI00298F9235|nr:hypothetical protein [Streptomyces scabiei]MDW8807046.1 hypothetical protein [Streptomyces scabiei]